MTKINTLAALLLAGAALAPAQVLAWGHTGHVLVGRLAIQTLPAEVPDFVRSAQAVQQIGELAAEAGRVQDDRRRHLGQLCHQRYPHHVCGP